MSNYDLLMEGFLEAMDHCPECGLGRPHGYDCMLGKLAKLWLADHISEKYIFTKELGNDLQQWVRVEDRYLLLGEFGEGPSVQLALKDLTTKLLSSSVLAQKLLGPY